MESVKGIRKFFNQKMVTLLVLLVVVIVVFTVMTGGFGGTYLSLVNFRTILSLMSVTGLLTIGVGCLIISGCIDLSTGASGTMCAIIMALMVQAGVPWPIVVILCLIFGMMVGVLNAVLVNVVGFQPFIATMAVASVVQGISLAISGGQPTRITNEAINYVGTTRIFNDVVPISILILVACFIIYGLMLSKSKFGRSIYLVGGNKQAAKLSGIDPVKMSYILFMNSGMLAALGGMLMASRSKSATIMGVSASQFAGVTAAMLGGI